MCEIIIVAGGSVCSTTYVCIYRDLYSTRILINMASRRELQQQYAIRQMEKHDLIRLLLSTEDHEILDYHLEKAMKFILKDNPEFHPRFMSVFTSMLNCKVFYYKYFILFTALVTSNSFFAYIQAHSSASERYVSFFRPVVKDAIDCFLCREDAKRMPSKHPDQILYPSLMHLVNHLLVSWAQM